MLVLPLIQINAQKKEIKEKFAEYTDKKVYTVDGNNVVVSAVIDNVAGSKEEVYVKVKNYFTRAYKDANSVIQTDDKEQGVV